MRPTRFAITALAILPLLVYADPPDKSVAVPEGTKVIVRATESVTPKYVKAGQKLPFVIHEDVVFDGQVVIRAKSPVEAIVTDSQPASSWSNRQGRLDFAIEAVQAVDGTRVELKNYKDYAQLGETPGFGHAYYSNPKIASNQTFVAAVKKDIIVRIAAPETAK